MTNRAKLFQMVMSFPEGKRKEKLDMWHSHTCKTEKEYVWYTIYSVMDRLSVKQNIKRIEAAANEQFIVNEFNLTE